MAITMFLAWPAQWILGTQLCGHLVVVGAVSDMREGVLARHFEPQKPSWVFPPQSWGREEGEEKGLHWGLDVRKIDLYGNKGDGGHWHVWDWCDGGLV